MTPSVYRIAHRFRPATICCLVTCLLALAAPLDAHDLPIDLDAVEGRFEERQHFRVRNLLNMEQLWQAIRDGGEAGLGVDFSLATTLEDGTRIDPSLIYGTVYAGPYPFEAAETDYAYKRFRVRNRVRRGKSLLEVSELITRNNSEGWTDRGTVCVRFELFLEAPGQDRALGLYDTFLSFMRTGEGCVKLPTIVEGPLVGMLRSDDPSGVLVSFRTGEPVAARVEIEGGRTFAGAGESSRHEIAVTGLQPATDYRYRVVLEAPPGVAAGSATRWHPLRTAPARGNTGVVFAYTGDSREGRGGGMLTYMGHNHASLERLASQAYAAGAEFLIMGGDLVNGFTTSEADLAAQFQAWKQAMAGFWHSRPVYPAMGNHDALLRFFRSREHGRAAFDRWPYATASAEAVFAAEFMNPTNGPAPSDPRRPTYTENVFSFQYGPVLCIAFNNNYWASHYTVQYGGCPEGFILDDQMRWIAAELERAEGDRTIRYVLLYAQEPVFPNGGHVGDSMWHRGDNRVRAATFTGDTVVAEPKGIVEVRNDLARLVARHRKVAAVLGSDEHVYHRVRIDRSVPAGIVATDDRDGNGVIDWPEESCSALDDLRYPTWYLTSGGAGAPYYAEEPTPWNTYWLASADPGAAYRYTSQENIMIFRADERRIGVQVLNPYGEVIDAVDDLLAIKR